MSYWQITSLLIKARVYILYTHCMCRCAHNRVEICRCFFLMCSLWWKVFALPLSISDVDFFFVSRILSKVIVDSRQTTQEKVALCLIASAMSMHPIRLLQARAWALSSSSSHWSTLCSLDKNARKKMKGRTEFMLWQSTRSQSLCVDCSWICVQKMKSKIEYNALISHWA
jgi:hypothetical protein